MEPHKFYIQQLSFDGESYTTGNTYDSLTQWGIVCKEFPFTLYPEAKAPVTRDWLGLDGLEVYAPATQPLKEYDIDVEFIAKGNDGVADETATIQLAQNIRAFLTFLYGRNTNATGSLLAIYDEYTMIGRKDVRVKKVSPDAYERQEGANPAVAVFKVTFTVYDPMTDVSVTTSNGAKVLTCTAYGN